MSDQISKSEVLALVRSLVRADPEFIGPLIGAIVSGAHDAVDKANRHAADMETLFVMSAMHGKLPTKLRDREYLATILERWAPESRFNFEHTIRELRTEK